VNYYSVSIGNFEEVDGDARGISRLWFLDELTLKSLEAELVERFGPPGGEAITPIGDGPSVVMLADSS